MQFLWNLSFFWAVTCVLHNGKFVFNQICLEPQSLKNKKLSLKSPSIVTWWSCMNPVYISYIIYHISCKHQSKLYWNILMYLMPNLENNPSTHSVAEWYINTLSARGFLRGERERRWENLWLPTTVNWSYCANRFGLGSRSDPASRLEGPYTVLWLALVNWQVCCYWLLFNRFLWHLS